MNEGKKNIKFSTYCGHSERRLPGDGRSAQRGGSNPCNRSDWRRLPRLLHPPRAAPGWISGARTTWPRSTRCSCPSCPSPVSRYEGGGRGREGKEGGEREGVDEGDPPPPPRALLLQRLSKGRRGGREGGGGREEGELRRRISFFFRNGARNGAPLPEAWS